MTDPAEQQRPAPDPSGFTRAFFVEMLRRILLALVVMFLAVLGSYAFGRAGAWGPFLGAIGGVALGVGLLLLIGHRRPDR